MFLHCYKCALYCAHDHGLRTNAKPMKCMPPRRARLAFFHSARARSYACAGYVAHVLEDADVSEGQDRLASVLRRAGLRQVNKFLDSLSHDNRGASGLLT